MCRYNAYMGGVDRCDQVRNAYNVEGAMKSKYWYKKVFFGLLGMAVGNAFIVWRIGEGRGKGEHAFFMQELFESLVGRSKGPSARVRDAPPLPPDEVRLQQCPHFHEAISDGRQLRCRYCNRKVLLQCDTCKQPLCSPSTRDCFKLFHTVPVLPTTNQKATKVSRGRPPAPSPPKGTPGRPRKT
jgi:hypothetical protein